VYSFCVGVYVVTVPGCSVEVVNVVSDPWSVIIRGQRRRRLLLLTSLPVPTLCAELSGDQIPRTSRH
jgi:hypothetical protein